MFLLWSMEKTTTIQAMNKKQLAEHYNIGLQTLRKWLAPFENQIGKYR